MTPPLRRFALAAVVAGGLGLAVPAAAALAADGEPSAVSAADIGATPAMVATERATTRTGEMSIPPAGPVGSPDPALLIGVGIAALAGAGGLFAAAQYAARGA